MHGSSLLLAGKACGRPPFGLGTLGLRIDFHHYQGIVTGGFCCRNLVTHAYDVLLDLARCCDSTTTQHGLSAIVLSYGDPYPFACLQATGQHCRGHLGEETRYYAQLLVKALG